MRKFNPDIAESIAHRSGIPAAVRYVYDRTQAPHRACTIAVIRAMDVTKDTPPSGVWHRYRFGKG